VAARTVPVVVAKYTPRAKAGGLGRSVAYYTWRDGDDRPRERPRVWHAAGGRELDYATARAEITAAAREAPLTYRLVLSPTAAGGLTPEDYGAVLGRHFERWYVVAHHFGDHPHAHALAPSPHRLDVRQLADLRAALGERSRERELERGREARTRAPAQERELW
jgi:hypothetical protein